MPGWPSTAARRLLPARAGASLSLVHRLYPCDRDGAAFLDQVRVQQLWLGHQFVSRVAVSQQRGGGADMVKSAGTARSSSSHVTGKDTGTPGRIRGLWAATTVALPDRVESRNPLPSVPCPSRRPRQLAAVRSSPDLRSDAGFPAALGFAQTPFDDGAVVS